MSKRLFICFFLLLCVGVRGFGQGDGVSSAVHVPEKVMAARLIASVPAKVPEGALKMKCSNALVTLEVSIEETGNVSFAKALSGYEELKEPAVAALKEWTYKPYLHDAIATHVQASVSLFFLGDGESFPMYSPDGKGGVKGGNVIPLPASCGRGPSIKRAPIS